MTDPEHRATMDVLTLAQSPALFTDENLHSLMICRVVNLSLEHGNSDASCLGYVALGGILRPRFGNPAAGFRFGQVGFDLVEQRGLLRWKARVYLEFCHRILPWTKHPRGGIELARRAFDAAMETGDLMFAAYACNGPIILSLSAGAPLAADPARGRGRARVRAEGPVRPDDRRRLDQAAADPVAPGDDAGARLVRRRGVRRGAVRAAPRGRAELPRVLVLDPQGAGAVPGRRSRRRGGGRGQGTAAAVDDAVVPRERGARVLRRARVRRPPRRRAGGRAAGGCATSSPPTTPRSRRGRSTAPSRFRDRAELTGAELARIRGEADQAAGLYEQAIRTARAHGFVQIEAIAYEVAARFHRARGRALIADAYVREAHVRYARWGAEGKARQLRRAHPELELQPAGAATAALRPEQLDRLSVIKASQTISSVMDKDLLSRTLLRFVLEEGGARRVVLVSSRDGELEIAAEARVDEPSAPADDARVPRSLLSYVLRTQEPVMFDAADDAGRFASDPYFADTRPRSVLCMPVRLRADSVALLYLENELVPGTFTPERLVALELLAAQAAISLENARLLERERTGRIEAEAAERRGLLLGEATALLSQTLESRGVLDALARLFTRSFADWALIDLQDDGALVRIAGAHRDPDKEPILREMTARYAAQPRSPVWQVLQTGQALEAPVLTDEQLRSYCVDDHHAELIRRLGARSAVYVPLCARDAVIGVLTLVATTPNRFARADAELAVDLGRRMALAIDNARLLDETRRALHLRDEFLRIASHELRTPLASLRLSAQGLLRAVERNRTMSPEILDRTLRRVLGNTMRLEQLTSELLDVTRIEQGRLAAQPDRGRARRDRARSGRPHRDRSGRGGVLGVDRVCRAGRRAMGSVAARSGGDQPADQRRQVRRRQADRDPDRAARRHRAAGRDRSWHRHRPGAPALRVRPVRARGPVVALRRARARAVHRAVDRRRPRRHDHRRQRARRRLHVHRDPAVLRTRAEHGAAGRELTRDRHEPACLLSRR